MKNGPLTSLESALAKGIGLDGVPRALNTAHPTKMIAVRQGNRIRVGVAIGGELLCDIADWRDVANLEGWQPCPVWDGGELAVIA